MYVYKIKDVLQEIGLYERGDWQVQTLHSGSAAGDVREQMFQFES